MAITYENVVYDRVIESLYALLGNEFGIPIRFDEHKGNQSFLITPNEDELIELISNGQTRQYNIIINYQVVSGSSYGRKQIKQVTEIAERVKRLIHNNTAYSPSDVYKWHDGKVENINYSQLEEVLSVNMEFTCISLESI
tara:strand:- start:363 stop:782 length:420 start_codon:yes stop_codon:yes gene_type:complete